MYIQKINPVITTDKKLIGGISKLIGILELASSIAHKSCLLLRAVPHKVGLLMKKCSQKLIKLKSTVIHSE